MGDVAYKTACPRCRKNGKDFSGDNLSVYTDNSKYCFACGYTVPSKAYLLSVGAGIDYDEDEQEELVVTQKEIISLEEIEKLKGHTSEKGNGYRGIRDDIYKTYIVRHQYDEGSGDLVAQYYPVTQDYKASGYKIRYAPKDFKSLGRTGKDCDLFGQWRFKNSTARYVVVCAGEIDAMSAFQMLSDYSKQKGSEYEATPCVSATVGESGSDKQIQKHYQWLDRFERIIVCYDNDEAGHTAAEKVIKVLPKGKAYVMELTLKDTNEYLEQGKQKEWINLFYRAKKYVPAGVLASNNLYDKIMEEAVIPKVPFPEFMQEVNRMLAGGISLGKIVNIGASSGIGKTSLINQIIHHWIFHSPHKIGVVSMELSAGQYGTAMLSHHIKRKITMMQDSEKVEFLQRQEVQDAHKCLTEDDEGNPRWYLMDDRDGTVESIKQVVEELVISCGCRVIVIDPLQDVLDGMSNEEQAVFLKWQKSLIKSHHITFVNINHVRKASNSKDSGSTGAFITEEDFSGSSTIFKSAALNLLIMRNKYAEDEVERNTTKAIISKNRDTGITGPCGEWYYDNNSHTLYDKTYYFEHVKMAKF